MSNIIKINFSKHRSLKQEFLDECKLELDADDYADLLEAINDSSFYQTCDEDIKNLVISYYNILEN